MHQEDVVASMQQDNVCCSSSLMPAGSVRVPMQAGYAVFCSLSTSASRPSTVFCSCATRELAAVTAVGCWWGR
jgi:hypothetical protein